MIFPAGRQFSTHRRVPLRAFFRELFSVFLDQCMPLGFETLTPVNGFAEMCERFVGNVKLLVFRPSQMSLRLPHSIFTGRIAVSFACALRGHAVADGRLD